MNEHIQSLWIGGRLSIMERLAVESFLQNGHSFHLYVYDDVDGVPKGAVLKDANEIIPRERVFRNVQGETYAAFSDIFRYKLLAERGGYWVDTDVVCLKPFEFGDDHAFVEVRALKRPMDYVRRRYSVTSWFIKSPPGSRIMEYCYREAISRDPEKLEWGEIGPRLIRSAVARFTMQPCVAPRNAFFPLAAREWRQLLSGSYIATRKWNRAAGSAYAIHLYNDMWRRNGVDKEVPGRPGSIYEHLQRRYLGNA